MSSKPYKQSRFKGSIETEVNLSLKKLKIKLPLKQNNLCFTCRLGEDPMKAWNEYYIQITFTYYYLFCIHLRIMK